jgi:anti-anti-sigma factor
MPFQMDVGASRIRLGVQGGIDPLELHQLMDATEALLEEDPVIDLHLDLAGAPSLDTATLNALLDLQDCARARGRKLVLLNPDQHLRRVLKVTGLDRKMKVLAGE